MYTITSSVPVTARNAAINKFEKIAARMTRAGLVAPVITGEKEVMMRNFEGKKELFVQFTFEVPEVTGLGFKIVGRVDNSGDENTPNFVNMYSGEAAPEEYLAPIRHCAHCGVNRDRNIYYIVENSDGLKLPVGSSCVDAMVGFTASQMTVYHFAIAEIVDIEDDFSSSFAIEAFELEQIVATSFRVIEEYGYISKTKSFETGEQSTANRLVDPKSKYYRNVETGELLEKARFAIAMAQSLPMKDNFQQKMVAVACQEYIGANRVSFAVYMAKMCIDFLTAKDETTSEWVGNIKERLKGVEVEVVSRYVGEGFNGTYYIIGYKDKDGNKLVWKSSTHVNHKEGDKLTIDFSVKSHDTYKGKKQTNILRVKEV